MNYGSSIEFMTSNSHELLSVYPKIIIWDYGYIFKCIFVTLKGGQMPAMIGDD